MSRTLSLALPLFLLAATVARADQAGDARAAYDRGDFAAALQLAPPLANQGNAAAEAVLGQLYANGHGVTRDYAQALTWFRKAAAQGDPLAERCLGVAYTSGLGVPRDYGEGIRWLHLAADQGDAPADSALGLLYETGRGVKQDEAEAMRWYDRGVKGGDLIGLAGLCATNTFAPHDLVRTYVWCSAVAAHGPAPWNGLASFSMQQLMQRMSAPLVEQARSLATAWTPADGLDLPQVAPQNISHAP